MASPNEIPIGEVIVVGEYTTSSGPFSDDYFLVTMTRSGNLFECPMDQARELIDALERMLNTKIVTGLANRTDFASRVIFPPALEGHPLFDFAEQGMSLWQRVKTLGLVQEIVHNPTAEIRDYCEGRIS